MLLNLYSSCSVGSVPEKREVEVVHVARKEKIDGKFDGESLGEGGRLGV
jgi:hypothetical protein